MTQKIPSIGGNPPINNSKAQLWATCERLMLVHYGRLNISRLARDAGIGLGTVARMQDNSTTIGLDKVEMIARAFSLETWQLLDPAFDPYNPAPIGPEGGSLARALEKIPAGPQRQRAYAMALQLIEFSAAAGAETGQNAPKPEA